MRPKSLNSNSPSEGKAWALKLFDRSPLKQRKLAKILETIGHGFIYDGKTCLDIGSDNGVISYLLRQKGGAWHSADLIPETVISIKSLVETNVDQINEESTPYKDNYFDLIVIVDFLEHIKGDALFISELYRILKPSGELVINVPNPKEGLLRKFKFSIGQTDSAHGHVRPGYSLASLKQLLQNQFEIVSFQSYGRVFSELFDTLITFALDILKGGRGKKGTVVTGADLRTMKKSFKIYSMISPILFLLVKLDALVPFLHGNMLIVKAVRK